MIIGNSNIIGRYNGSGTPSYLLDTYSATAAYSLRQLKTGVAKVVRVRRSSDNREENFTATEVTDGTLTGFCGVGDGFVVTWYDQSGNGNDITQSTAGSQSKLVSSGSLLTVNSKPSTIWNNSYYSCSNFMSASYATVFMVLNNSSNNVSLYDTGNTTNKASAGLRFNVISSNWRFNTRTTTANVEITASYNTSQNLLVTLKNSTDAKIFENGTQVATTSDTGTINYTSNTLFKWGANATSSIPYIGDMQELILFNTDESSNRSDIESDINGHYSIY